MTMFTPRTSRFLPHRWLRSAVTRRVVWSALALVHVSPLLAAMRHLADGHASASWLSAAGLGLSLAFFALKACDVRFLRCTLSRGQVICLVLGAALVHQDVLPSNAQRLMLAEAPTALVLAAGFAALRRAQLWQPRMVGGPGLRAWSIHAAAASTALRLFGWRDRCWSERSGPQLQVGTLLIPRAPPAR
jgi:hypothetical protein